jgi:hypothetical protein
MQPVKHELRGVLTLFTIFAAEDELRVGQSMQINQLFFAPPRQDEKRGGSLCLSLSLSVLYT